MAEKVFGLCEGRHPIPGVTDFIFGNTLDVLDVQGMEEIAAKAIADYADVVLYVTGLSVALSAVIAAAVKNGTTLWLMHYDRDAGTYYKQQVTQFNTCPFCGARVLSGSWHCPQCGAT